MPLVSSTAYTFRSGPPPLPTEIIYPIDTLIAYNGNDPLLSGWTRYSTADGYYLASTTNQSLIGTVTPASGGSSSGNIFTGSGGSHTGSPTYRQWITSNSGSSAVANSSGGSHNHSINSSSALSTPENMLNRQTITFLRATESKYALPANSLVFKDLQPDGTSAYGSTSNTYLKGTASGIVFNSGSPQNNTINGFTSTDGSHSHLGTTLRAPYSPVTGGWYNNYNHISDGGHSHTYSATVSQSTINSRLYKVWQVVSSLVPTTDTIVMYVGNLANLPRPWYICNGLNGTINIGEALVGYNTTSWGTITNNDFSGSVSVVSTTVNHAHASTLVPTATNVTGPSAYHLTFSWTHTHTSGSGLSNVGWVPPKINVAFIQYRG
jgi:hypothetical protein